MAAGGGKPRTSDVRYGIGVYSRCVPWLTPMCSLTLQTVAACGWCVHVCVSLGVNCSTSRETR